MNPSIGSLWRFKSLHDETPEERAANTFQIVGHDGIMIEYLRVGSTGQPTRRLATEFHRLFERINPPIE